MADSPSEFAGIAAFAVAALVCWCAGTGGGIGWRRLCVVQVALLVEVAFRGRYHLHNLVDELASAQGWYAQRVPVQLALLTVVATIAMMSSIVVLRDPARGRKSRVPVLVASIATILAIFIFSVEAVSMHAIDAVLYREIGPFRAIAFGWIATAGAVTLSALTVVWS